MHGHLVHLIYVKLINGSRKISAFTETKQITTMYTKRPYKLSENNAQRG